MNSIPASAVIEITPHCNWNCFYCANLWKIKNDYSEHLPTKNPFDILNKLLDVGVDTLKITGGEPLLYDKIVDFCQYAYHEVKYLILSTNGSLISKYQHTSLFKNIDRWDVSFNSNNKQTFKQMCQGPGEYEKTRKGIDLLESNEYTFGISLTAMSTNYSDIYPTCLFFKNFQYITDIGINFFRTIGKGKSNEDKSLTLQELRSLLETVKTIKTICTFDISVDVFPKCLVDEKSRELIPDCSMGEMFAIDAWGNFKLCPSSVPLGNIFDKEIEEFWSSPQVRNLQKVSWLPELCMNCPLPGKCKGGCKVSTDPLFGCDSYLLKYKEKRNETNLNCQ
jgi:radical SAM protein with 4Fe4S-binding SPASM domain